MQNHRILKTAATALMTAALFGGAAVQAQTQGQMPVASGGYTPPGLLQYTSPAPRLMGLIAERGKALGLSAEQEQAFKAYRQEAAPKRAELEKRAIAAALAAHQAALDNAPASTVMAHELQAQALREQILHIRLQCRDFVRKTLNDAQWQQLLTMYAQQK